MIDKSQVSTQIFLYYESTGKHLLDRLSSIYNGPIYLSLVNGNCHNDILINYAQSCFEDIKLIYVDNCGSDQYGFYHSFKLDDTNKPWIFYCHDKSLNKIVWLNGMMDAFTSFDNGLLDNNKTGIIAPKNTRTQ